MKTVSVALVLCLNVGVDPPDVIKTNPCARMECWIGNKCQYLFVIGFFLAVYIELYWYQTLLARISTWKLIIKSSIEM